MDPHPVSGSLCGLCPRDEPKLSSVQPPLPGTSHRAFASAGARDLCSLPSIQIAPFLVGDSLGESSWSTKSFLTTVMPTRFSQSSYILKDYIGLTELVAQFDSRIILRKDKMNCKDTNVYFIIIIFLSYTFIS